MGLQISLTNSDTGEPFGTGNVNWDPQTKRFTYTDEDDDGEFLDDVLHSGLRWVKEET